MGETKKICLNMIVKNESHIMKRCLENISHLVDAIYILDTGSEDDTIKIIEDYLKEKNIPGCVTSDPWDKNFGRSRTLALRRAEEWLKGRGEDLNSWYAMFHDADNSIHIDGEASDEFNGKKFYLTDDMKKNLKAHRIMCNMKSGGSTYDYCFMVSLTKVWTWKCVLHEYVDCEDKNIIQGKVKGFYIDSGREGFRSKNPNKYKDDADVFYKFLEENPNDDRGTFYLAQSLRDAGINDEAIKYYIKRADMENTFEEERYCSYIEAAKIMTSKIDSYDFNLIVGYLMQAIDLIPWKLEAVYYLMIACRQKNKFKMSYALAKGFQNIKLEDVMKRSILFTEEHIYKHGYADELSLAAFYSGDYKLSYYYMCLSAPYDSDRIGKNLSYFKDIPIEKWALDPPR